MKIVGIQTKKIALALLLAMLASLFAFVFHIEFHKEHLISHSKTVCFDRAQNDISHHLHSTDEFPHEHGDCECQICNLSYLDLFFSLINQKGENINSSSSLFVEISDNSFRNDFLAKLFLRSPPHCYNV